MPSTKKSGYLTDGCLLDKPTQTLFCSAFLELNKAKIATMTKNKNYAQLYIRIEDSRFNIMESS